MLCCPFERNDQFFMHRTLKWKEGKTEEYLVLTLYQFCFKNLEVTMTSPLKRLTVSVSIFFCSMLISFLSCSWTVTC